ncbi:MAG: biopolymer transporter ExbD [Burkholderiaceae bacterium]
MPAISQRNRGGGRGRRMMNEINVVPYIDVMLVLLVIFMVTAPLMPPGVIDLPRAGKSNTRPDAYVEVQVRAGGDLRLRSVNAGDSQERRVGRKELVPTLRALRGDADVPVVISAERSVRYEAVVDVMDELHRQNVNRVALMVKPAN